MPKSISKKLVLASASPRRIQLLKDISLKFIIHPSNFEEKDTHLTPEELVTHNALGKAQTVAREYKNALIIGVDTVGVYRHHIINKPKNRADAQRMIKLLAGSTHKVLSGIAIIDTETGKSITEVETTKITMDQLSDEEIAAYVDTGEGDDKAAGYAIQGRGALYIEKIEGDYFNVVGLPLCRLRKMLQTFNYVLTK